MLVLSRYKNETIRIRDDVVITVIELRGDKVRLGVEAPKEVPVHRGEVYEAIKRHEAANQGKPYYTDASGNVLSDIPQRSKITGVEEPSDAAD